MVVFKNVEMQIHRADHHDNCATFADVTTFQISTFLYYMVLRNETYQKHEICCQHFINSTFITLG